MKIALVESTAEILTASASGYKHPFLTYARFVLADDKPNGNNEGVSYEEFEGLRKSVIDMPIKLRLVANAAGGHKGSVPIGHVQTVEDNVLEDGTHQLIANAVLYAEEYPEEVAFLKDSHTEGKAPGISWELRYQDSFLDKGIKWLKGVVATAATFVGFPAYGTRTALLALASTNISDADLSAELSALASEISPKIVDKGGTNMDEKEKKELLDKIAALETQLGEANQAKAKAETDLLTSKAEVTAKEEVIAQYAKNALIDTRTKAFAEAGLKIEVDDAKKEFLAGLSEAVFTTYLADLKAASVKTAVASQRGTPPLPKLGGNGAASDGPVDFETLKDRMQRLSRNATVAATE